jgi:hypothetical protein
MPKAESTYPAAMPSLRSKLKTPVSSKPKSPDNSKPIKEIIENSQR